MPAASQTRCRRINAMMQVFTAMMAASWHPWVKHSRRECKTLVEAGGEASRGCLCQQDCAVAASAATVADARVAASAAAAADALVAASAAAVADVLALCFARPAALLALTAAEAAACAARFALDFARQYKWHEDAASSSHSVGSVHDVRMLIVGPLLTKWMSKLCRWSSRETKGHWMIACHAIICSAEDIKEHAA
eukprot:scaffold197199_cov20-Tisochrysis_lutea.AAC.3